MTIVDVQTLVMGTSWRNLIFVKIVTDEGLVGIGEATLENHEEAVLAYLEAAKRKHIVGSDPFRIEDLWYRMFRDDYWRGGVIAYTGISGVEIACWDIVGKATGQPVYNLLGGTCHERLKVYANGWYTVERKPKAMGERAKSVIASGYRALKVDPFGAGGYELDARELRLSIDILEAIREAVGPEVEIFVEGHGRFSPATALKVAKALEPLEPGWFEEPVPPDNYQSLARVAAKARIPIATGERCYTRYGYKDLLAIGAADIVQPDLLHAGGILETKKIAAMADAHHVLVAPHNANSPVSTAVALHLDATLTNFKIQETFDDFADPFVREAVDGVPRVEDGAVALPNGPGFGIRLNEDVIKEHPYRPIHFNLFAGEWQRRFAEPVKEFERVRK